MVLYCRVSLNAFVESFRTTSGPDSFFTLPAKGLMHIVPQEEIEYGLSLLRESIGLYEKPGEPARSAEPSLLLELDYQSLGELCLFENYSLLSCKYEREPILNHFTAQLEKEYDTFFFDEEHTGFTPDSRFFSMLCNACLEVKQPSSVGDKEWRLASLQATDEVLYRYEHGNLIPYVPISMPVDCLKRVYLEDFRRQPLLFGTLNGFLKSKGLPAEQLLNLS